MAIYDTYKPVDYFTPNAGRAGILTADDLNYFEQQRRRIRNEYLYGEQQAKYQGTTLQSDYDRSRRDLARQFDQVRTQLPGSYAAGNALNSGGYQRALSNYSIDRNNGFSDLSAKFLEQRSALDQSMGQLSSVFKSASDDVASAEAARRATAEAIRLAQTGF